MSMDNRNTIGKEMGAAAGPSGVTVGLGSRLESEVASRPVTLTGTRSGHRDRGGANRDRGVPNRDRGMPNRLGGMPNRGWGSGAPGGGPGGAISPPPPSY